MDVSQNGWPVNPPRTRRLVAGTKDVFLTVADGAAGDVLMYVAEQFDRRVEDLDLDSSRGELDDWGHADRPIRGGRTASNHASATAVDFNATRHPLSVRGTFTRAQVAELHRILAEVDGVVRWGGDYFDRADEMHFEINATPARVAQVATALRTREDDDDMNKAQNDALAGTWQVTAAPKDDQAAEDVWNQSILGEKLGYIVGLIKDVGNRVSALEQKLEEQP